MLIRACSDRVREYVGSDINIFWINSIWKRNICQVISIVFDLIFLLLINMFYIHLLATKRASLAHALIILWNLFLCSIISTDYVDCFE